MVTILLIFVLLTALGWLERRSKIFLGLASGSELCKLDGSAAAFKRWELRWSAFEAGNFEEKDSLIKKLELVELMTLTSGEAPLTNESRGSAD